MNRFSIPVFVLCLCTGCNTINPVFPDLEGEQSEAFITVGDAQVFSRESLINDRLREQEFIQKLLDRSEAEDFSIASDIQRQLQTIRTLGFQLQANIDPAGGRNFQRADKLGELEHELQILRLQAQIESQQSANPDANDALVARVSELEAQVSALQDIVEQAEPEDSNVDGEDDGSQAPAASPGFDLIKEMQGRMDSLQTAIKTNLDAFDKSDLGVNPIDHFRDLSAYRGELRAALDSARLDDSHDRRGNSLYRLRLNATVFPGENTEQYGAVDFRIQPHELCDSSCVDGEVDRLYFDWLAHLTYRINEWSTNGKRRLPDLQLPLLESTGLFRVAHVHISKRSEPLSSLDHKCARIINPMTIGSKCETFKLVLPPGQERYFPPDFYNYKYILYEALLRRLIEKQCTVNDQGEIGPSNVCDFELEEDTVFEGILERTKINEPGYHRAAITTVLGFAKAWADLGSSDTKEPDEVLALKLSDCVKILSSEAEHENVNEQRDKRISEYSGCIDDAIKLLISKGNSDKSVDNGNGRKELNYLAITSNSAIEALNEFNSELDPISKFHYLQGQSGRRWRPEQIPGMSNKIFDVKRNNYDIWKAANELEMNVLVKLIGKRTLQRYRNGFLDTRKTLPAVVGGLHNRSDIPENAVRNFMEIMELYRRLSNLTWDLKGRDDGECDGDICETKHAISKFARLLKKNTNGSASVYSVAPAERVQRISTMSDSLRESTIAASVSAMLPGKGIGGNLGANYGRRMAARVQAIERNLVTIGYSESLGQEAPKPGDEDRRAFGWIFGPPAYIDTQFGNDSVKLRHRPAVHELSVDLSIPSWWPNVTLSYTSAWIDNWREARRGIMHRTPGSEKTLVIELPLTRADLDSLTRYVQDKARLGSNSNSKIVSVLPENPSLCDDVRFIIRGANLWRNPKVRLGGVEALQGSVAVLPDMDGIEATFGRDDLRRVVAGSGNDVDLAVLTQTGMDRYGMSLAPVKIENGNCSRISRVVSPAIKVVPSRINRCPADETIELRVIPTGFRGPGAFEVLLGGEKLEIKGNDATGTAVNGDGTNAADRSFGAIVNCNKFSGSWEQTVLVSYGTEHATAKVSFAEKANLEQPAFIPVAVMPQHDGKIGACESNLSIAVKGIYRAGLTANLLGVSAEATPISEIGDSNDVVVLFKFSGLPVVEKGGAVKTDKQTMQINYKDERIAELDLGYIGC